MQYACAEGRGTGKSPSFPPAERGEAARGAAAAVGAEAGRGLRRRLTGRPAVAKGGASRAAPAGVLKATAAAFALARRQN